MRLSITKIYKKSFRTERGIGLVEVMVALLVLGVGLLGVLTLQKTSLQFNQNSYYYSQADTLVNDIVEKMRANRNNARSYRLSYGNEPGAAEDQCVANTCTEAELAQWDVALWRAQVARVFPGSDAEIIVANLLAQNPSRVSIRFSVDGLPNNPQVVALEFRL